MSRKKETGPSGAARKRLKMASVKSSKRSEPKRFKFQTFKQQLNEISIESIRRVGGWKGVALSSENASWFEEAVEEWRELNCTAHFARFCAEIRPYIGGGLPQVVFHQAELKAALLGNLAVEGSLAVTPLSALIAMLARDLATDFGLDTYRETILALTKIISSTEVIEDIESVVRTMFYLTRVLEKQLVGDLASTFSTVFRPAFLLDKKPKLHVIHILVELWATLGRKILLPAGVTELICEFARKSQGQKQVGAQLLASICFDGRQPMRFLPKHLKAFAPVVIAQGAFPLIETVIEKIFFVEASEAVCKAVIESLSSLDNPDTIISIVNRILETNCVEPSILSLIPVPCLNEDLMMTSAGVVCKFLLKRGVDLPIMLKARPIVLPILSQTSQVAAQSIWTLLNANKDAFVHILFSASAIEKVITDIFPTSPVSALALLDLCRKKVSSQLPSRAPIDYASLLASSNDHAAVALAVRLMDHTMQSSEVMTLAKRLLGESVSTPNPLMLALLDAWASHGDAVADEQLVELISGWTGYASVLDLLRKSKAQGETALLAAKRNLLSGDSSIRASALLYLESISFAPTVMENCKKLELESVWAFNSDREKGIHLEALYHQLQQNSALPVEDAEMVMRQLVGVVLGGFRPVQAATGRVLTAYVQRFGALFRQVIQDALSMINEHRCSTSKKLGPTIPESLFDDEGQHQYILALFEQSRMYGPNAMTSLFEFLAKHPASMDFVQNDFIALLLQVFAPTETTGIKTYSEEFLSKLQTGLGPALTAFAPLKNLSKNPRVTEFSALLLDRFLPMGDASIQSKSLDVLLAIEPVSTLWKDHLHGILESEQKMREHLVELSASAVPLCDDLNLLAILVRVLYGRLVARKGAAAGRTSPKVRRKLILNYVAAWERPAVGSFIDYLCSTVEDAPSVRSVTGFLSLLEPVLSKLGRFTPVLQFSKTVDLLLHFAILEDKNVRRLAMQRIHQIWHVLVQPGSKEDPALEKVLMDRQSRLWDTVVMPRLSKLEEEYGQAKSSLLDLLELWAAQRPALVLSGLAPMASALGSVHRVKPVVAGQLTTIFESLLLQGKECEESLGEVLPTLFKSIAGRLESLLRAEEARLSQRLLQLLVDASTLLTDVESCSEAIETLVSILFSCDLFKSKRYSKMESMQTAVLRVLIQLVPLSHQLDAEKAYKEVSTWFGVTSLKSRPSREALAALFSCVAALKNNALLDSLAACLVEMNSFDATQVDDEPDWERRTAGFNKVRALSKDADPSVVDFWLPLLSWAMHSLCLEGDDIGARNQALFLLESFLESCSTVEESSPAWNELVIGRIYLGIRKGMTGGSEEVRASLMALLGRLVDGFPASKTFGPLSPLLAAGDEEANVLLNLGHIQVHRRTRAVRRLGEFYAATNGIDRRVVEEVFLPFLRPLAIPSANPSAPALNALLQTEAIQSIAILTAALPPKSVLTKISMTLKRLKAQAALDLEAQKVPGASKKPNHQVRALLRLVPAMIQRCLQVEKLVDEQATDALLGQLFEAALPLPGSSASPLTLPLAESIGAILSGPQRTDQDRSRYLPKLMAVLCQGLTDKDHAVRESCRTSLAKLIAALGPAYLGYALTEMESVLMPLSHQKLRATRGSTLIGSNALNSHVYGFSVAALIESMPEGQLVLSDQVYSTLLRVVLDHGFGPLAREKTRGSTGASGQEWTGRAAEARHQKAYDLLAVLVRKSASVGHLLGKLVEPLAERIKDGLEDDPDQVDAAFKSLETALLARIGKTGELREHMVLLHALMKGDEPQADDRLYGHRFALLAINVLVGLLKDPSNVTRLSGLLDGFVPVLVSKHLAATCKHQSLTTAAIKALTALINAHPSNLAASLPSLIGQVESGVIGRCFEILVKTDAGRFQDLCSSALRLISTAVRTIPGAKLTDSQTRALLSYTRAHLEESSSGKSTLAFSLLRTLLSRRVLLPELLDLVSSIATTMIVSPDASVRSQCRSVYQQFLVEYPLGPDKLHEHLSGLLKNMAGFEWDTGRQSATLVAGSLVTRLPASVLSEWSSLLLVNVATRFAPGSESSKPVREALVQLITSLSSRLSSDKELQSAYQEASTLLRKWIQVGKPAVSEAAWIMSTPFVAGIKDDSTGLRAFLLEEAHGRVQAEPSEAVLGLMIQIGDASSAQLVLHDDLMLHASLVVRDKVNCLLVPHLPTLLPAASSVLSSAWSQQLLQLPGETDPSTSDLLIRCLLATIPHLADDGKCTLLAGWDRPLRPILAEPGLITKNRVTVSAVLKILAGILSTCPVPPCEDTDEFSWLGPLCSIAIRTATSDHLSATQSSLVDRGLAEQLRTAANELLELIQAVLGPDTYTRLTQSVIQTAAKNKSARKTALSHLAVNDPEAYARRKMGRNAAKKEQRKRQVDRTRERAQKRQRPSTSKD